ncbi:MAG: hypothetical protein ACRDBG_04450 [Waterburya sp.]
MKIYVRGNKFPSEIQKTFNKAELKKYWLTDEKGYPVGKPFLRRGDIDLYQSLTPEEPYQILANSRGKPKQYADDRSRKAAHDRKRDATSVRKAYKAALAKKRREKSAILPCDDKISAAVPDAQRSVRSRDFPPAS